MSMLQLTGRLPVSPGDTEIHKIITAKANEKLPFVIARIHDAEGTWKDYTPTLTTNLSLTKDPAIRDATLKKIEWFVADNLLNSSEWKKVAETNLGASAFIIHLVGACYPHGRHHIFQEQLGEDYFFGKGVDKDIDTARAWFQEAVDNGNLNALCNLGQCHDELGTEKGHKRAFSCYFRGALNGDDDCIFNLAQCYLFGEGVPTDHKKAKEWLLQCKEPDPKSFFRIGDSYDDGKYGLKKNPEKTFSYFLKAAEMGDRDAQFNVGYSYVYGLGVAPDLNLAIQWFKKAADQGDEDAEKRLEECKRRAAINLDYCERHAKFAFSRSLETAKMGHLPAQFNVGHSYLTGNGVAPDLNLAIQWFKKAADQGDEDAVKLLEECKSRAAGNQVNVHLPL